MKKQYMKPAMQVVEIRQQHMLCYSPYDSVSSPLDIFDTPEDVIIDKGSICPTTSCPSVIYRAFEYHLRAVRISPWGGKVILEGAVDDA